MTPAERAEILDAVADAVIGCETLKVLTVSLRLECANLVRREVARKLFTETVPKPPSPGG